MVSRPSDRSNRDRKRRKPEKRDIPADAVVSLSSEGRAMYEQFLAFASQEAGKPITGEQLILVLRDVRAELGTDNPDFTKQENIDCFKRHSREFGQRM